MAIYDLVPDPAVLLALEPEEVAGVVLEYLNGVDEERDASPFNKHNFSLSDTVAQYPARDHEQLCRALMEGWAWLEREGLLASEPGNIGWFFITRRGQKIGNRAGLEAYRRAALLPQYLLHPRIASKVVAQFIRGDYDVAVFQAFKEVEVGVRDRGGFGPDDYGTTLMREAFNPNTGPLRDPSAPMPEREATSALFAGAIGLFKNPQSHRHAPISDPAEAVELLLLANHLLRTVESRAQVS